MVVLDASNIIQLLLQGKFVRYSKNLNIMIHSLMSVASC